MHSTFSQFALVLTVSMLVLSGCSTKPKTSAPTNAQSTTSNQSAITKQQKPKQNKKNKQNLHTTSQACIDVIKEYEGVRLDAYAGPAGNWLIGYGHKEGVFKGMKISADKAEEILKKDLLKFEKNVRRLVTVNVNQNQFSALVCLSYNIGSGNFARSTLLRKLNKGDYTEAANQFAAWRMVNGKVNNHQVKRREKERAMFVD